MKRTFRLLLAIALLLLLIPHAFAETYNGSCGKYMKWTLDTETGALTITGEGEMLNHPWESYNNSIQSVTISDGVTNICSYAFSKCENLTQVSLPNSIAVIGEYAFHKTPISSIELPDHLTTIERSAFDECTKLEAVIIPDSVSYIGYDAFEGCKALKEVILQEGLVELGPWAFSGCSSLQSIVVPQSVTAMGRGVFQHTGLIRVVLPDGLESIPHDAFYECHDLVTVFLPKNLKTIDIWAFYKCTSLTSIVLPEGLEEINDMAFRGTSIEQLIIPSTVTFLGDDTLAFTSSVKRVAVLNADCEFDYSTVLGKVGQTTIYCHKDSTAHAYAVSRGYAFEFITEDNLWEDKTGIYNPFTDVAADSFYEDSVLWAVENGITNGTSETTFAPTNPCKRSEVVTFLHRAQGKPVPSTVQSEFSDVQIGKFYTDAVAWAVENSITNGMGDGTFGVSKECTRAQVVTFLWRAAGCPQPTSTEHPFTDLNPEGFYYDAVLWAVENGITSGMSATTFVPGGTCTRAQIVTFLYRFAG